MSPHISTLSINDKVLLSCGSFGIIKKIDLKSIEPLYIKIIVSNNHSPFSANFNSGWKEELMVIKKIEN